MAALKRKEAPKSHKASGHVKTKKPKIESISEKKSLKKTSKIQSAVESNTAEEIDISESDNFGGFSEDDRTGTSISEEEIEAGNDDTNIANSKHANGVTQAAKPTNASVAANSSNSSKEAHAKQKVLAQERKASKPNADFIARTKKIWERLRRKSHVPREERKELVTELYDIITGRVKDFVFKHDSVRVVQTALKYANLDQRKMIARELKGEYRGLAESRYAKFLIGKMLVHGDEEIRDMIVPEFYGHVRRMIKHPEASWILDDIYRGIATPHQKAIMLREWYGAEFAIFKADNTAPITSNLADMLAQNPEKRTPIIRSLHDLINQLVQKKTTGFTMLHDAMLQYFLASKPGSEEATDFIELLKGDEEGDLLKNLAFTKSGARLVCLALAYGSAKDRKHILKTYKDTIQTLAYDTHGHQVILAAYDVVDDTVLTSKAIFPELLGKDNASESQQEIILGYIMHLNGRIPLLYLFAGKAKWLLPDDDRILLDEIHGIRTTTSKKEPETRRKELVRGLSIPCLTTTAAQAETLLQTSFGCQFISEVLLGAEGEKKEALEVLANLAKSNVEAFESPAAGRMLKALVFGGRFNPKTKVVDVVDPPLQFHDMLYAQIESQIVDWAIGPNSFVVLGLLEAQGFLHKDSALKILRKNQKLLERAATEETKEQKALKEGDDGDDTKSESRKSKSMSHGGEVGNKGTKLLLKQLV